MQRRTLSQRRPAPALDSHGFVEASLLRSLPRRRAPERDRASEREADRRAQQAVEPHPDRRGRSTCPRVSPGTRAPGVEVTDGRWLGSRATPEALPRACEVVAIAATNESSSSRKSRSLSCPGCSHSETPSTAVMMRPFPCYVTRSHAQRTSAVTTPVAGCPAASRPAHGVPEQPPQTQHNELPRPRRRRVPPRAVVRTL